MMRACVRMDGCGLARNDLLRAPAACLAKCCNAVATSRVLASLVVLSHYFIYLFILLSNSFQCAFALRRSSSRTQTTLLMHGAQSRHCYFNVTPNPPRTAAKTRLWYMIPFELFIWYGMEATESIWWRRGDHSRRHADGRNLCHDKATGSCIRSTSEWTLWLRFLVAVWPCSWRLFLALEDGSSSVQTCCFRTSHPRMHKGISATTATADDIRSTNEWTLGLRFLVAVAVVDEIPFVFSLGCLALERVVDLPRQDCCRATS